MVLQESLVYRKLDAFSLKLEIVNSITNNNQCQQHALLRENATFSTPTEFITGSPNS